MNTEVIWNPGSYAYAKSEKIITDWEENITEKRDRIQVMLEDVEIDQSVISSEIISSTDMKTIDDIIELREPVLHHKEKNKPMYVCL